MAKETMRTKNTRGGLAFNGDVSSGERKEMKLRDNRGQSTLSLAGLRKWFRRAGGVAQVIGHLRSKCTALSSSPRTTKKKN
jgi:hypothetical protein